MTQTTHDNGRPVALITGGAKRLGAESARALHHAGYNIVLHYRQSATAAEALADQFNEQRPDSCRTLAHDLTDLDGLEQLADRAAACFDRLDLLLNNASSFYPTPVGTMTTVQWRDLVATNMSAPLFLSQACAPHLEKHQGCIINMVDIHAERPLRHHTIYCMAKAGLRMMTLSLAQELAPSIRVNGIAPGAILWPEAGIADSDKDHVLQHIPLQRKGESSDIAQTVLFLADRAGYITGQIIAVDGGRSIASSQGA